MNPASSFAQVDIVHTQICEQDLLQPWVEPWSAAPSEEAPAVTASSPSEPEPVAGITPPPTDPREQWLTTLYESPSVADRLQAAQQIAARGSEMAFRDLATFVAAAEANR
jgi:hypothetical protein